MRLDPAERRLRKDLRKLLPANQHDVAAIETIRARGYPAVEPILLDLLKWLRGYQWPVSKPACEFLVSLGPHRIPQVQEVLGSRDHSWMADVLRDIVSLWPGDDVRPLSGNLHNVATHGHCGADLLALRLLARHGIGDPEWIAGCLEVKRQHHEKRLSDIADIVSIFEGRRTP